MHQCTVNTVNVVFFNYVAEAEQRNIYYLPVLFFCHEMGGNRTKELRFNERDYEGSCQSPDIFFCYIINRCIFSFSGLPQTSKEKTRHV
jgi:hypothetical protein